MLTDAQLIEVVYPIINPPYDRDRENRQPPLSWSREAKAEFQRLIDYTQWQISDPVVDICIDCYSISHDGGLPEDMPEELRQHITDKAMEIAVEAFLS